MSDVNANIDINIDGSQALAEIKRLQREISLFYTSINKGSASAAQAAANMQKNLVNSINATGDFTAQIKTIQTTSESFTTSLEKNKFSMREYFRYGAASTKTFGKLFKSEFNTIEKTAIDRVKKLQTQYIKLGRDANGAMKAIAVTPTNLNLQDTATKTMIAAQKQQIFNQLLKQGSTNLLNFGKNTQWAGRQLMVGFTVPLTIFGNTAAKAFMEIEEAVVKFKRVYGDMYTSSAETDKMAEDLQRLAEEFTKYGLAVADTMNLAAEAAAMGKQGAELTAQVSEATRLAVLGGVEQTEALQTTISLTNAFGVAAEDLGQSINFLNSVENQTVTSIEDLTIAIPKAGPVVKQLGGDVKDLAFFLTAMKEGGINASEGANALKSGLASLINPTAKASEFLASLGINISAIVEGNKGNLRETVVDFAQALDTLDPLNRARAIEQLFGKFQFARLSTLFTNVSKDGTQASQVLNLASKSVEELAILSERELGTVEDSVGKKFAGAIEKLKAEIAPIGKIFLEAVTPIVQFVSGLIEKFNNLGDGTKKVIAIIVGVLGVVGPAALMAFGLLANGLANIIKFIVTLRNGYQKLTGQSKYLGEQTQYMTNEQIEAAAVAASLDQAHANLTQRFTSEAEAVEKLVAAYQKANAAGKAYAGANPGSMLPPKRGRYATGVVSVPGPKGAGDIVPAMLSPGEAVIPAKMAEKYAPLIKGMISGNLPGYAGGGFIEEAAMTGTTASTQAQIRDWLEKKYKNAVATGDAAIIKEFEDTVKGLIAEGGALRVKERLRPALKQVRAKYEKPTSSTDFAHAGSEGVTTTAAQLTQSGTVKNQSAYKQLQQISSVLPDARVKAVHGWGFDVDKSVNRRLPGSGSGVGPEELGAAFDAGGIEKWRTAINVGGGNFEKLAKDIEIYDQVISQGIQDAKKNGVERFFDTEEDIQTYLKRNPTADRTSLASIEKLHQQAKQKMVDMGSDLANVIDTSEKTVTEYRMRLNKEQKAKLKDANVSFSGERIGGRYRKFAGAGIMPRNNSNFDPTKEGKEDALDYKEGQDSVKLEDPYERARNEKKRNSPHADASKDGADDAKAYKDASQNAMHTYGKETPDATDKSLRRYREKRRRDIARSSRETQRQLALQQQETIAQQQLTNQTKQEAIIETEQSNIQKKTLREKIRIWNAKRKEAAAAEKNAVTEASSTKGTIGAVAGKLGGVGMAASTAVMVGSMIPGQIGEMSQKLMGPVMALSMLAPLLPALATPWGALIAAVVAVTAGFLYVKNRFDSASREGIELANSMRTTKEELDKFTEITGEVSASAIQDRKKEALLSGESGKTRKFGMTYMESEAGKQLLKDIDKLSKEGMTPEEVAKNVANQLAYAVAQGVITTDQAKSISSALGEQLKDYTLPLQISGNLVEILGVDGEDLLNNPLKVVLEIQAQSVTEQKDMFEAAVKANEELIPNLQKQAVGASATAVKDMFSLGGLFKAAANSWNFISSGLEQKEDVNKLQAAAIQLGIQQISQNQGLVDSINEQYDALVAKASTEKEILEIERKRKITLDSLNKSNAEVLDSIIEQKDAFGEGLFQDAINAEIDALYKGKGALEVFADQAQNALNVLPDSNLKTTIQIQFAAGELDPTSALLLAQAIEKDPKLEVRYDALVEARGVGDANLLLQLLQRGGIAAENISIYLDMFHKDKKNWDSNIEALSQIASMKTEYGITINITDPEKIQEVAGAIREVEDMPDDVTKQVLMDYIAENPNSEYASDINLLINDWDTLTNSADSISKQVIVDIVAAGDFDVLQAWAAATGIKLETLPSYAGTWALGEAKKWLVKQNGKTKNEIPKGSGDTGKDDSTSGGGGSTTDPYEEILNKLKQVRDAAINAAGGLKELLRVAGQGKNIKIFQGMNQQLTRKGYGQDFVDAIMSMDEETRDKFAKVEKGTIKLTAAGKALAKAYKEVSLGELSVSMTRNITDSNNQIKAFNKLKKAGFDTAKAYELLQDTNLAAAVAGQKVFTSNGKLTAEFKRLKQQIDNATKAMLKWKLTSMEGAIDVASQGVNAANSQFDTYTKMVQSSINLSVIPLPTADEGNRESLIQMQSLYAQMQANSESIADNNRLIADTQNEISAIQSDINAKQREMASIQRMVEINFDRPIKDMQDRISQLQRDIELQFTRPIEELQETINDMQRASELKFDRPMKALQDESTRLSNDLAIMDNAAEEINKKYEAQAEALNKVAEANQYLLNLEKQRVSLADALTQGDIAAAAQAAQEMRAANAQQAMDQANAVLESSKQAELDALRSESGMTREEIAKRQYEIGQQTYELEQQKKIVDEQILAIQDQIYNLQEQQELKQSAIRDIEDQIYQLEQARKPYLEQIEAIQESIALIELNSLQPLQDKLDGYSKQNEELQYSNDKLQFEYDQLAENLTVQGKTQKEWQNIDAAIAAANITTSAHLTAIKNTKKALEAIVDLWNKLKNIGNIGLTVSQVIQTVNAQGTALVAKGGLIPEYLANGGSPMFKPVGTDTVPAMLTPGEFVVRKAAVDKFGIGNLMAINSGKFGADAFKSADFSIEEFKTGNLKGMVSHTENNNSVYNYAITVNGGSSMSADDIANTVISKIKTIDSYRVRSQGV